MIGVAREIDDELVRHGGGAGGGGRSGGMRRSRKGRARYHRPAVHQARKPCRGNDLRFPSEPSRGAAIMPNGTFCRERAAHSAAAYGGSIFLAVRQTMLWMPRMLGWERIRSILGILEHPLPRTAPFSPVRSPASPSCFRRHGRTGSLSPRRSPRASPRASAARSPTPRGPDAGRVRLRRATRHGRHGARARAAVTARAGGGLGSCRGREWTPAAGDRHARRAAAAAGRRCTARSAPGGRARRTHAGRR